MDMANTAAITMEKLEMWLLYSLLAIGIVWIVISPLTCCRHK